MTNRDEDLRLAQLLKMSQHAQRAAVRVLREQHEDIERLREEVRVLRLYGNKDCTAMADEAMKERKP